MPRVCETVVVHFSPIRLDVNTIVSVGIDSEVDERFLDIASDHRRESLEVDAITAALWVSHLECTDTMMMLG